VNVNGFGAKYEDSVVRNSGSLLDQKNITYEWQKLNSFYVGCLMSSLYLLTKGRSRLVSKLPVHMGREQYRTVPKGG
jgi:hypothetical protein